MKFQTPPTPLKKNLRMSIIKPNCAEEKAKNIPNIHFMRSFFDSETVVLTNSFVASSSFALSNFASILTMLSSRLLLIFFAIISAFSSSVLALTKAFTKACVSKVYCIKSALVCITITIFFCLSSTFAQAITIQEAITLAIQNSTELEIERKKTELAGYSKADAVSMFLPNANYGMRKGDRKTSISTLKDKLKEDTKTLTVSQPLFTGFQGVSRVKEAIHKTAAAKENMNFRKNEIALMTAESYLNILKLRNITELEAQEIVDYKKLLELARKKLELGDIEYSELSKFETQNQNTILQYEESKAKLLQYELSFELLTKQKPEGLSRPLVHSNLKNLDDTLILAQKQNPKVKSAQHALKAAKTAVMAESGKVLPKVLLSFQHEHQQSSYYFNGQTITNKVIYLDINIPIFQSGSEYAGIAKANKQKQIANLENKLVVEELEQKVRAEYTKFTSLKESLRTFSDVLKSAIQSLKLAESRFNKKDLSQMDYLLKKIEISEVKKQAIATECDMLMSWFTLQSLINEMI